MMFKKEFFLSTVFLLQFIGLVIGQEGIQVTAGPNYAKWATIIVDDDFDKSDFESTNRLSGLNLSVLLDLEVSERFSIQTGLNLMEKGEQVKTKNQKPDYDQLVKTGMRLRYLQVPVLFQYSIPIKKWRIFLGGGPSIGYAISGATFTKSRVVEGDARAKAKGREKIDFKKQMIERFDINIQYFAGVAYEIGVGEVITGLQYNRGVINLDKQEDRITNLYNQGWGWYLGYRISLNP